MRDENNRNLSDEEKNPDNYKIKNFTSGKYYKTEGNTVMYVMGTLLSHNDIPYLVCQIYMWSFRDLKHVLCVQGVPAIKKDEWTEITKEEFDKSIVYQNPEMEKFAESAKKYM